MVGPEPGVLRWGGSGAPRPLSSTPLDPRGTRPPRVGACIGLMGLPWPWCPSNATNLGGRGRQIFRGHLDLSRFGAASDEIVCKKKEEKNWNIIHINYCSGHILLVSFSPYVRGRWTPSPGVQVESVNIRFC